MAFRLAPIVGDTLAKKPARRRRPLHQGKDPGYLAFLHTLECCVTGVKTDLEAHHPTVGRNRMGRKEDDATAVPLARCMHSDQYPDGLHRGERAFWNRYGIDPESLAADLYALFLAYGAAPASGHRIIRAHRALGQVRKELGVKVFDEKAG